MEKGVSSLMLTTWAAISALAGSAASVDLPDMITKGNITGGLVAQVGVSDPLLLKDLGERFHVRLVAPDAESAAAALNIIVEAELHGQFTVDTAPTGELPFADRVLNTLVIFDANRISAEEKRRVLTPRGLLIEWKNGAWTARRWRRREPPIASGPAGG